MTFVIDVGLIIFGTLVILFSKRMVEANARAYPRLYNKGLKASTLFGARVVGVLIVLIALRHLLAG